VSAQATPHTRRTGQSPADANARLPHGTAPHGTGLWPLAAEPSGCPAPAPVLACPPCIARPRPHDFAPATPPAAEASLDSKPDRQATDGLAHHGVRRRDHCDVDWNGVR